METTLRGKNRKIWLHSLLICDIIRVMKNKYRSFLLVVVFLATMIPICGHAQSYTDFGVSIRRHGEHGKFGDYPFGNRDHSLGIHYEFHEAAAYWQLGVWYTPSLTAREGELEAPDFAWTPEINLMAKDNMWHGGIGIASTYTDPDGDWTSIYWQFILGLRFDLTNKFNLSVYGYYPFERWGKIADFRFRDIEYGLRFGRRF